MGLYRIGKAPHYKSFRVPAKCQETPRRSKSSTIILPWEGQKVKLNPWNSQNFWMWPSAMTSWLGLLCRPKQGLLASSLESYRWAQGLIPFTGDYKWQHRHSTNASYTPFPRVVQSSYPQSQHIDLLRPRGPVQDPSPCIPHTVPLELHPSDSLETVIHCWYINTVYFPA